MCEQDFEIQQAPLFETSLEMGEFFGALAKAQSEIGPAKKDLENKHLRKEDGSFHRYSSLTACLDACRPLGKNGISITQTPVSNGNGELCLITVLGHSSGEWMKGTLKVPELNQSDKQRKAINALQTMGVRLTFAKRYMLTSMTGVASDEDTDGEVGAGGNGEKIEQKPGSQNRNGQKPDGNSKPIPPRPWAAEMTKEIIWTKAKLFGKSVKDISDLPVIDVEMTDMLREKLTDVFAGDEKLSPEDVNKIIPDFFDGCFGVSFLAELKAPFGPAILQYIAKSDREILQKEILAFMKDA